MDRTITAAVEASPADTIAALADLGTYPQWLSLVTTAEPARDAGNNVDAPAWLVTLRARLGPFARSKRLRMVRTELDERHVLFERREIDGRNHADWVLRATVDPRGEDRCEAKVHLHYGGALWSTPLEIVLASFEGSAADRLTAYLAS